MSWMTATAIAATFSAPTPWVVMHATPFDQPPPLTPLRLLTAWTVDPWVVLGLLVMAALYAWGVIRLRRRGDRWPIGRIVAFGSGIGGLAIALLSVLGTYDTVLISVHMVQHMLLTMVVPMFLALSAPVTLSLRTLPPRGRGVLTTVLHARVVQVLTFPLVAFALYIANPFILYFTDLYEITLRSAFWHDWLHVHFLLTASLFYWPLVGVDPLPNRLSYPFRLLIFMLTLPFHAFLGVSIMSMTRLIAEDWYVSFERAWPPSPLADQTLAGGILWGSGDGIALLVIGVLFVQWVRQSQAEARREDRRLDRMERQRARAAPEAADSEAAIPAGSAVAARYDAQAVTDTARAEPPRTAPPVLDRHRTDPQKDASA